MASRSNVPAGGGDTFVEYVREQMQGLPELTFKRMFGGTGVYSKGVFFAIVYQGRLYFRTSDRTRLQYEAERMDCFRPTPAQSLKEYFEVPPRVIEERDEFLGWARAAIVSRIEG